MLTPGMHGSTFGGNPLACAAGLAVLDTIAAEGLLDHAREAGEHLERRSRPSATRWSPASAAPACCRRSPWPASTRPPSPRWPATPGFIVNPVAPDAIRLAPPLVVTTAELDLFVDALPGLLDAATTPEDAR